MAFWNPAEIVGVNPHPLDYSLYRAAVTRSAWNEGLVPLGYRRVPEELMCRVGNKPYVRLRPAFRSLIPAALDDGLARRLEDLYMRALASDWTAHDKIEFEVACSCWDLSAGRRVDGWVSEGLTVADARAVGEALRALTAGAVRGFPGWAARDGADSARLGRAVGEAAREMGSGSLGAEGLLAVADRLLGACCSLGTPQFARQARLAFVSRSICRSAVEEGVVGAAEMDAYLAGLSTVAGELGRDLAACAAGELPEGEFMRRYGHLRSGTYDITSPRYDAMPIEAVFGDAARRPPAGPAPGPGGGLGPGDLARVASGLGLDREGDAEALGRFLRGALESRERFKFEFTKALSLALEAVAAVGERVGLGRGDMAFLTVEDLRAAPCYPGRERGAFLRDMSAQRRARFEEDSPLVLPDVLDGPGSLDVVEFASARPNFVTGGSIVAEAASHMAIRCAEFGLPAAIGCGRRIFSRLRGARAISIDCRGQRVEARP
jgi:hypothetical protein